MGISAGAREEGAALPFLVGLFPVLPAGRFEAVGLKDCKPLTPLLFGFCS